MANRADPDSARPRWSGETLSGLLREKTSKACPSLAGSVVATRPPVFTTSILPDPLHALLTLQRFSARSLSRRNDNSY